MTRQLTRHLTMKAFALFAALSMTAAGALGAESPSSRTSVDQVKPNYSGIAAEPLEGKRGFGGGFLGFSSVDHSIGTGVGFGVDAGYFLSPMWGVGAFLRSANHNNSIGT